MREINVAVIGSGSTYCPELVDGFLKAKDSLKLKKISFMDIDERKRTIVGDLCVRMLKNVGNDCEVVFTDDLDTALQGADFVVFRCGRNVQGKRDELSCRRNKTFRWLGHKAPQKFYGGMTVESRLFGGYGKTALGRDDKYTVFFDGEFTGFTF